MRIILISFFSALCTNQRQKNDIQNGSHFLNPLPHSWILDFSTSNELSLKDLSKQSVLRQFPHFNRNTLTCGGLFCLFLPCPCLAGTSWGCTRLLWIGGWRWPWPPLQRWAARRLPTPLLQGKRHEYIKVKRDVQTVFFIKLVECLLNSMKRVFFLKITHLLLGSVFLHCFCRCGATSFNTQEIFTHKSPHPMDRFSDSIHEITV